MFVYLRKGIELVVLTTLLLAASNLAAGSLSRPGYLTELEAGIVSEINLARKEPHRYATYLDELRKFYHGRRLERPGRVTIITREGVAALDEAVQFLRQVNPLKPVGPSEGMSRGAKDHVDDQGSAGSIGHRGSDGSYVSQRVNRYGRWQTVVGENIFYGGRTARDVVMQLIIDDGVADRGHRKNFFDGDYAVAGVGCGDHYYHELMCVITLAGGYREASGQVRR